MIASIPLSETEIHSSEALAKRPSVTELEGDFSCDFYRVCHERHACHGVQHAEVVVPREIERGYDFTLLVRDPIVTDEIANWVKFDREVHLDWDACDRPLDAKPVSDLVHLGVTVVL